MKTLVCCIGFLWALFGSLATGAQTPEKVFFRLSLTDKKTGEPLAYGSVRMAGALIHQGVTDADGLFFDRALPSGSYLLKISYVGYKDWIRQIAVTSDTLLQVALVSNLTALDEVVVTATESRGMTSSSVIDRKAMQHLQPSSFSDLLELLPGKLSSDPSLTSANLIGLRQVPIADSQDKYRTSSLGTSFLVDGIPMSTNADMNVLSSAADVMISGAGANAQRSTVNAGVDMRAISTDEIERVEFVRGIPSVRYGDLTSGMVKIERKRGKTPLIARFKADGYSKLFAVGKGWDLPAHHLTVNAGIDYLDAKSDPTNQTENFERINASLRFSKKWLFPQGVVVWSPSLDFGHTLDKDRTDPDADYTYVDRYRSGNDRFAFQQTLRINSLKAGFFRGLEVKAGANYALEQVKQTKFVQVSTPTAIPDSKEEGEHDGLYLPSNWTSYLKLDGRPLNLFAQADASFRLNTAGAVHDLSGGLEWSMDKNYGKGTVYDVTRPPTPESSTRPRPYSDIPAAHRSSFYAEDEIGIPVRTNLLKISGGLRGSSMLHLEREYKMHGKIYWEPRVSLQWIFPSFPLGGKDLNVDVTGGWGLLHKFPTLIQLYPDHTYIDIVQLNYYHVNPDYRRIYVKTIKRKYVNYELEPALNRKIDLRLNLNYEKNYLSVTYFKERMTTGFRAQMAAVEPLGYKEYILPDQYSQTHVGVPDLSDLTYRNKTYLRTFNYTGNGSSIFKEGVEVTFQGRRWEALKTRASLNGAWLKTTYKNSSSYYYYQPSILVNDEWLQIYGVYKDEGGYVYESLRSNLVLDTYLPELGFEFSTSVQCAWFLIKQNRPTSETPEYYIDPEGNKHLYTEADKTDPYLHFLYRQYNQNSFRKDRTPLEIQINLKASKKIKENARVSLFVNRLLEYSPDYKINGAVIRRNADPYFGMELSFTL